MTGYNDQAWIRGEIVRLQDLRKRYQRNQIEYQSMSDLYGVEMVDAAHKIKKLEQEYAEGREALKLAPAYSE